MLNAFLSVLSPMQNILITETGHIKVTDFGGCRPVTDEAKALVKQSSKNLLEQLRDGDWKTTTTMSTIPSLGTREENHEEDLRIEGTTGKCWTSDCHLTHTWQMQILIVARAIFQSIPPSGGCYRWISNCSCRRLGSWMRSISMHIRKTSHFRGYR